VEDAAAGARAPARARSTWRSPGSGIRSWRATPRASPATAGSRR
jgi:hypothetical protein